MTCWPSFRRILRAAVPRPALLAVLLAALLVPVSAAAQGATITYRKVFKQSSPEFVELRIRETGECTYDIRKLDDEAQPQPFEVSAALRERIFRLAEQLNYFRELDLDVRRRIANLGQKTLRYERDNVSSEVTFNYTLNAAANQLMQIFEGLGRQQEHAETLARRIRYDRLGVNEALLRLEADLNRKGIPEPERLLPVLEQIAGDTRVIEIARHRARALADRIRSTS